MAGFIRRLAAIAACIVVTTTTAIAQRATNVDAVEQHVVKVDSVRFHAVTYPADVKRLVLTESNIPGVTSFASPGIPSDVINLKSWQFAFNRLNDLPEILVQGHERDYLTWIFATKSVRSYAIEPAALDEYTR
jgi:hypothetical protein